MDDTLIEEDVTLTEKSATVKRINWTRIALELLSL